MLIIIKLFLVLLEILILWYVSYYFHHLYHEKTVDYWKNLTDETIKTDFKEWLVNNKNVYTNLVKDFLPEECYFF